MAKHSVSRVVRFQTLDQDKEYPKGTFELEYNDGDVEIHHGSIDNVLMDKTKTFTVTYDT